MFVYQEKVGRPLCPSGKSRDVGLLLGPFSLANYTADYYRTKEDKQKRRVTRVSRAWQGEWKMIH